LRFKAAIFDLDGTLINSLEDIGDSVNQALAEHGFQINPINDYRYFIGNGAKKLAMRATHGKATESDIENIVLRYREIYKDKCFLKTHIYEGITELLSWLDEVNITCAVLSNKKHELTNLITKHYFPKKNFFAIYGHKVGVPIKPDPTQALKIISEMNCKLEDIVYIGDTDVDIMTAKNAGVFVIGALWGFRDRAELLNHGADAIAKTPVDVIEIIRQHVAFEY